MGLAMDCSVECASSAVAALLLARAASIKDAPWNCMHHALTPHALPVCCFQVRNGDSYTLPEKYNSKQLHKPPGKDILQAVDAQAASNGQRVWLWDEQDTRYLYATVCRTDSTSMLVTLDGAAWLWPD
jgi:hypothetical protein